MNRSASASGSSQCTDTPGSPPSGSASGWDSIERAVLVDGGEESEPRPVVRLKRVDRLQGHDGDAQEICLTDQLGSDSDVRRAIFVDARLKLKADHRILGFVDAAELSEEPVGQLLVACADAAVDKVPAPTGQADQASRVLAQG